MPDITFTSVIRPVSLYNYNKLITDISTNVNIWEIKGAKKGLSAKTDRIMDCTCLGITDGESVYLMHIIPELSSDKNYFAKIIETIKKNIDLSCKYLQALLVGSKNYSRKSQIGYNNFARFLKENKIPYSEFKGGESIHKVAYKTTNDEWLITNYDIDRLITNGKYDSMELLQKSFDKVHINQLDDVS